ncbi:MAG: ATP-dependent Clp protease ATP-binding subunit [Parcubacteria group bacterium]|nr:ATP-dependent Clp protease ATP-binding subunit [Parcubacteria group bacterium]
METKTFIFKDPYIFWPEWKRFLYRVIFQAFIFCGLLASLLVLLLEVQKYFYLGILFVIFFIFIFIKKNFSDFPLERRYLEKKKVNLALFLSPRAKEILIEARKLSLNKKIDFPLACLMVCLMETDIITALRYLDITEDKIKEMQNKISAYPLKQLAPTQDILLNLVEHAVAEAINLKQSSVTGFSLMLALYNLNDKNIEDILNWFDIQKSDLAIALSINLLNRQKNIEPVRGLTDIPESVFRPKKVKANRSLTSRPTPTLDNFSVDFTELASRLKIGIMIGHLVEYENLITILNRPGNHNVLLVGPAGIGKETIVSYLAYNLVRNNIPRSLSDYRLINLSFASLFKDIKTPFEACNRLTTIIHEILLNHDIILYLPQLHNYKLLVQEGGVSAFEILKPLFESPTPIIATTTLEDYHLYLEHDSSINDIFEIIKVNEVSPEEAIKILAFQSISWYRKTKVQVSYRAIKRAVILAQRFLTNTPLPSSAESLLTEAIEGARRRKERLVTEQDIVNLVSVKTNIPLEVSQSVERERLLTLEKYIHEVYINQEEAVKLVSGALRQYRAGLANPNKPIGVFLFVGPTGVGKTELAKILTRIYFGNEKSMVRFDMSEYQDPRGVFRFIGDPEGATRGALTEAIKTKPFSLILLDEFEKAHQKVLDLFLPLFDEGRLTDNLGDTINFTNTIIIATSNALSDFIKKEIEKGTAFNQLTIQLKQKLTNYFKPELLNRFDEVVVFRPLTEKHLREIVKIKLNGLQEIMGNKKIELNFDETVVNKLAQLGYNPIFGARPLDAVIRHFIKDKLAELILTQELSKGCRIQCAVQDNEFKFIIT